LKWFRKPNNPIGTDDQAVKKFGHAAGVKKIKLKKVQRNSWKNLTRKSREKAAG